MLALHAALWGIQRFVSDFQELPSLFCPDSTKWWQANAGAWKQVAPPVFLTPTERQPCMFATVLSLMSSSLETSNLQILISENKNSFKMSEIPFPWAETGSPSASSWRRTLSDDGVSTQCPYALPFLIRCIDSLRIIFFKMSAPLTQKTKIITSNWTFRSF